MEVEELEPPFDRNGPPNAPLSPVGALLGPASILPPSMGVPPSVCVYSPSKQPLEALLSLVSRAVHTRQIKTQPMMDIIIAIISVPLLVIFSFMLQRHMRSDWLHDLETRWRILGLGLSLLFISLVVCLYVTHRLGLCIWAAQQQRENRQNPEIRRVSARGSACPPLTTTGSQLHLMVSRELPPSYDSIMRNSELPPPPYFSVLVYDEKSKNSPAIKDKTTHIRTIADAGFTTRSPDIPGVHHPPSTG